MPACKVAAASGFKVLGDRPRRTSYCRSVGRARPIRRRVRQPRRPPGSAGFWAVHVLLQKPEHNLHSPDRMKSCSPGPVPKSLARVWPLARIYVACSALTVTKYH